MGGTELASRPPAVEQMVLIAGGVVGDRCEKTPTL